MSVTTKKVLTSVKSTYPITSFEARLFSQNLIELDVLFYIEA